VCCCCRGRIGKPECSRKAQEKHVVSGTHILTGE
jgi:hypothetical protein